MAETVMGVDGLRAHDSRRRQRSNKAEQESAHYRVRNRMPTIDLDENPFCIERQLADMEEQIQHNKNPRCKELSSGENVRSHWFVGKKDEMEEQIDLFKSRVLRQAMAAIEPTEEGVRSKPTRAPVAVKGAGWMFDEDDKNTVRDFGHRPRSASRTFNPLNMRADPVHRHKSSKDQLFMTTTVLYHLLHPPPKPSSSARVCSPPSLCAAVANTPMRNEEQVHEPSVEDPEQPPQSPGRPQWDSNTLVSKKYFSYIPNFMSAVEWSSAEKLTRFKKNAAGSLVPELYRDRHENDLEERRETAGTYFPRRKPKLLGERLPLTPRTLDCNQHIQRILKDGRRRQEHLDARVREHEQLEMWERIPKLPPLQI